MEWVPISLTKPTYSGYYEVKVRVQLDMFEELFQAEKKSVVTAWYDAVSGTFKEKNTKNAKQVEHIDAWRVIEL